MSDLISKQRAIEAIDRFIPADPMMSDYTHGISVGLAIATRCIEKFSQENDDSSQGLVKQQTKRQATIPSDCISRQDAIKSMANAIWHYPNELYTGLNSYEMSEALAKDGLMFLPSAEPKTPSNGSITCMNPENTHVRTMGDLISRQDAIKVVEEKRFPVDSDYAEGFMKALDRVEWILKEWLPSAEKAQLSGEDATSVCKCPCEYREPCDVCHYDAYRKHGCPAEEGMKDE